MKAEKSYNQSSDFSKKDSFSHFFVYKQHLRKNRNKFAIHYEIAAL